MLTEEEGVVTSLGAKKLTTVVAEAGVVTSLGAKTLATVVAEAGVKRILTVFALDWTEWTPTTFYTACADGFPRRLWPDPF
jgi:hypothetical protein